LGSLTGSNASVLECICEVLALRWYELKQCTKGARLYSCLS